MSCFWTSILHACRKHKLIENNSNIDQVCRKVMEMNTITDKVLFNGKKLEKKLLEENFEAVKNYDATGIRSGHLTSSCEPFFCLLAQLTNSTIVFNFNGHEMKFDGGSSNIIRFRSNRSHIWFAG